MLMDLVNIAMDITGMGIVRSSCITSVTMYKEQQDRPTINTEDQKKVKIIGQGKRPKQKVGIEGWE